MRVKRVCGIGVALAAALAALSCVAAADEWINLFDGATLYGWMPFGDAQWKVADGSITCEAGSGGWLATTGQFQDFELAAKVRVAAGGSMGLIIRGGLEGHPSENGAAELQLAVAKGSAVDWHEIAVKAEGNKVTATLDGKEMAVSPGTRPCGYLGFAYGRNGKIEIAQLKLRPLGAKPIFNGKDLTGWNAIPEHKSVFSVDNGALHIVNGNGQIETAGTYKNFLLQLDILANGDPKKPLNSGVFYRGPVGVFWKGYEIQVRNQWQGEDRTKPVDFGTGGNYGNQPARKVVPTEKEWYTMTIEADGNHTSVWVNGYQVSDYLDDRPVSPESQGKEGYVPGPGVISLQGHDPTTDMSFKNIMLAEYPSK